MGHVSYIHKMFRCAKCQQAKPLPGRKKYKVVGEDSVGRKQWSYQCAACAETK